MVQGFDYSADRYDNVRSVLQLLFVRHLGLQVDGQNGQRGGHILILDQDALGNIQMDRRKVPDRFDTAFDQLVTDRLGMLGGYSDNTH